VATSSITKLKGLHTYHNHISSVPEGSMETADNVVIDADNTVQPRRGMKTLIELDYSANQLMNYKTNILAHFGGRYLGYLNNTDPASLTTFKKSITVTIASSSDTFNIIDHALQAGDLIYFNANSSNPIPTGITDYDEYVVLLVLTKDTFKIALNNGLGVAVTVGTGSINLLHNAIVLPTETNLRLKSIEMNGNLYMTTSSGISKVSAVSPYSVSSAGGIAALNCNLDILISSSGFFAPKTGVGAIPYVEVGYRVVWGTKDVNGNLILGNPSELSVIGNYTGNSTTVNVSFAVPQGITTDYFYQIYRTKVAAIGEAGDEQNLIIETPYDGVSTFITVNDNTPEDIRNSGTPLYVNEVSGEGILQTNYKPPIAKDIATYKNRVFYANTTTPQRLEITFLGFDGMDTGTTVTSISSSTPTSVLTLSSGPNLTASDIGSYIAFRGANDTASNQYQITAYNNTTHTITISTPTSVSFPATGWVFKSFVTVTKSSQVDRYFFVGQQQKVRAVPAVLATIVNGTYFRLISINGIKYAFYFDKTGTTSAPVIASDYSYIKIDLSTGVTNQADVCTKIANAINNVGDFDIDYISTSATTAELIIKNSTSGVVDLSIHGTTNNAANFTTLNNTYQIGFGEDTSKQFVRLSTYASPSQAIEDTAKSLVKCINVDTTNPLYAYYLSNESSLPGQIHFEERTPSSTTFTISSNSTAVNSLFNPALSATSENNESINAIYFSKVQQPEAVPLVNKFEIGPRNKKILRIMGLRDSLFILKEEGIYILTGESEQNFAVRLFDNSGNLIAPDSVVILNNQIYCITTQGVGSISESGGLQLISRSIENIFLKLASDNYPNFKAATFGVSYETDRAYLLFTVDNPTDTYATKCYRFNTFTQTWTTFSINGRCGLVHDELNKLYIGSGDINAIEIERKTITSRDYADREYTRVVLNESMGNYYLDTVNNVEVGDLLTQRQYFKTSDYNRVLNQMKTEPTYSVGTFPLSNITDITVINNPLTLLATELNTKDTTLISVGYNAGLDTGSGGVNLANGSIIKANHGFSSGDFVLHTVNSGATPPTGLVDNEYYEVIRIDNNEIKLRPKSYELINNLTSKGIGKFTFGTAIYYFNYARDIESSFFNLPDHGYNDGDVITYNSVEIGTSEPTGLLNNQTYEVVYSDPLKFKIRKTAIKITAAGSFGCNLREVYYYSGTTSNIEAQTEFNNMISKMNDSDAFFLTYPLSSGYQDIDYYITSVNNIDGSVQLSNTQYIQYGDMIHYKSIDSRVIWNFITLGEPTLTKHIRFGSVIIKNTSFYKMKIGFASNYSGNFENIEFTMDGSGRWGAFTFGSSPFGGQGIAYPMRTLIPKQKQRCQYIKPQFVHASAMQTFSILGVSFDYEITSERTSKR